MRFLISVIGYQTGGATPDEMAAIDAFNDRLVEDGHWVMAAGLADPSTATLIDNRGGAGISSDGPLVASREYVSGFWIIEAPSEQVALDLASEGSRHCNRRVELRALLGG